IRGDFFGFGAGANSILGHYFLKCGEANRYGNANIRDFVANPLEMSAFPMTMFGSDFFTGGTFKAFATREGLNYERFSDQFGCDFRELRRKDPGIDEWFEERRKGGAVFVETNEGISLSPETWVKTMIWRR